MVHSTVIYINININIYICIYIFFTFQMRKEQTVLCGVVHRVT